MLKINNERVLRPSPSLIIDQTNVIGHLTVINNEVLTFVFTIWNSCRGKTWFEEKKISLAEIDQNSNLFFKGWFEQKCQDLWVSENCDKF